jgi:hypothetical protein
MRLGTNPLLECRRIFHSRDVDETRAWLRSKEFRFDLLDRQHVRPDVRVNGVYLPNMYLGYLQYGVQAVVRAAPTRKDYWIHLPIRGSLSAEFGSDNIACNARRAAILSPTRAIIITPCDWMRVARAFTFTSTRTHCCGS